MGKVFHVLLAAIFLVAMVPFYVTLGARYDGEWFPVVGDFEIVQVEPDGDGSLVYVSFNKFRECKYLGIAWFSTEGGIMARRELHLKDPNDNSDSNRPRGAQVSGPWRVDMHTHDIRNHSLVTVTHQCVPFYVTRTQLFP